MDQDSFDSDTKKAQVNKNTTQVLYDPETIRKKGMEFMQYGKFKKTDIRPMDYKTKQAWSRIRKHIKDTNQA